VVLLNAKIGSRLGGDAEYWNGSIDDVRIYNRALSQEEVTRIYLQNNNSLLIS
jgi:hypothetical protein